MPSPTTPKRHNAAEIAYRVMFMVNVAGVQVGKRAFEPNLTLPAKILAACA
jgi:hypothetical protein